MGWFDSGNAKAHKRMAKPCPKGGQHDFETRGYGNGYSTYTCRKCDLYESIDLELYEQR